MDEKTKLELNFIDSANKNFKLSIDEPRQDLGIEEINQAADSILTGNIFTQNNGGLRELLNARKVTTKIEEILV